MKKFEVLILIILLFTSLIFSQQKPISPPKIDGKLSPNEYQNYVNLSSGDFRIFWSIIKDEVFILMIGKTKGWVALGIDPSSKAGNADYIIGYVTDKEVKVLDYFAPEVHLRHTLDEKLGGKNDILDFAGTEDKEFTYIEFKRKLSTKDKYDKEFPSSGKLNIVWALGPSDDPSSKHIKAGYGVLNY